MTSRSLRVVIPQQVADFVRGQAPAARHRLRLAIRDLAYERGDIEVLDGALEGYHRLRVGPFRIVFAYASSKSGACIQCIFIEHRSVVYLLLENMLHRGLLKPDKGS